MKSVYSHGEVQKTLVDKVQNPAKWILGMSSDKASLKDFRKLIEIFRDFISLPEPTKEGCPDDGSAILLDIRDEFFRHLKISAVYEKMFRRIINFVIGKRAYDNFYKQIMDWWLGEIIRRGYPLPGHNRPSSDLWLTIPPETRVRLSESIRQNYSLLQERLSTIKEKLGDSEEAELHKKSRLEQFVNRLLTDFEREVRAWE